jgi:Adenylate and Guanylate cyclase catalytic domain
VVAPRDIEKLAIVGDAPNHDVDVGGRLWWAAIQSSPVSRSCSICRMRSRVKPRRSPIRRRPGAMMNRRLKLPPLWKQTWFPILVMFLIALYFAFLMIHTGRAIGSNEDFSNLLVLGLEWQRNAFEDGPEAYRIGTFVAISFAYLGWYVWSIATIFTRHATLERTGDGVLVEFRSVVDAVRCAIEMQNAMIERNAGLPPERRIQFRVGIHLGDVVEENDGDLMGDGVNIAARLEGIGEPNGICLSGAAYEQVRDKVNAEFVDLGDRELKNIARPVRAYRVTLSQNATKSGSVAFRHVQRKLGAARQAFDCCVGVPEHERRPGARIFR